VRLQAIFFISLFAIATPSCALAADDKSLDAPAASVTPATTTLAAILAAHEKALGTLLPSAGNTARESWAFTDSHMNGTLELARAGGSDYHSRIKNGPFTEQYGQYNHKRWHQDQNGITTDSQDTEERSFYTARVLEDAADPKNDAKVLGESAAPAAYVVEVRHPGDKHPDWVFYDKATFLIDRVESIFGSRRLISTYSDYRNTKGRMQPWRITDTDGRSYLDDDYRRVSLVLGGMINNREFQPPPDSRLLVDVAHDTKVPGQIVRNYVVVRVVINGRGLDFELSSGENDIAIDRDVARELALPTYGQTITTPEGNPRSFLTIIPDFAVGEMHLKDVVVDAIPIHYHLTGDVKVVGRLGYDFLKNQVLKVDYPNETITAMSPKAFDGSPADGVYELPVRIENGYPFITAKVGATESDHFMVDNAQPNTVLFGDFTRAHPDDVRDLGRGTQEMLPITLDDAVGHNFQISQTEIQHFVFGPADYNSFVITSTNIPLDLQGSQVDGIIGRQFLEFYDIVFDYPHHRLLLKPNKWFLKYFSVKKG